MSWLYTDPEKEEQGVWFIYEDVGVAWKLKSRQCEKADSTFTRMSAKYMEGVRRGNPKAIKGVQRAETYVLSHVCVLEMRMRPEGSPFDLDFEKWEGGRIPGPDGKPVDVSTPERVQELLQDRKARKIRDKISEDANDDDEFSVDPAEAGETAGKSSAKASSGGSK